jgi:hypothetical protein
MTDSLKHQWDSIPEDILTEFGPRIKQGINGFWENAAQSESDNWSEDQAKEAGGILLQKGVELSSAFKAAGGTEAHWTTITNVVMYGKYDKFQAKP